MTPNTILLATDLSARCDRALDRAVALAAEWHARLVVVHAIEHPQPTVNIPAWRRTTDPREVARQQIERDMHDAAGMTVDVVVAHGDPATLVAETARTHRADVVVTAVARDEPLGRFAVGRVVEKLAKTINVPLLMVRARPERPYRKALVAIDLAEGSRAALAAAATMLPNVELSTLHVYDVPFEGYLTDRLTARELEGRQAMARSREFIDATPEAAERVADVICEYGDLGSIPAIIGDQAHLHGFDLVVLGTEGRRGMAGMILGSVALKVMAEIGTDVLLVRRNRDGSQSA
jgi:nucleotide-binding universal stress UspA family protein